MAAPMSDVSGYRSDGGGLGQDQGISKQLKSILTAKLPLLSSPGTVLENSLYYDINSSTVTAVEEQATFNKDRIALNNFTMGSTPSAYVPSVLFANTVFWVVSFDADVIAFPNPLTAATEADYLMNIPEGWGFAALKNIIVYMGASSIAQIQISAITNFLICCATCEVKSKRDRMIEGAGRYLNIFDMKSPIFSNVAPGVSLFGTSNYGQYYTDTTVGSSWSNAPWLAQAVVPLRLPWSSMAILDKRLSLDTKLSTQPIQITLATNVLSDFSVMTDYMATNVFGRGANAWKSSTIQIWQEELSDKSLSVRNELLAMPEFNVGYPFQYAQSIPFEVSTVGQQDTGQSSVKFTMNITSIINSDLTTFLFNVTWAGRQNTTPSSGQYCPLYGEELINIELLLNGQRFFAFDQDDYSFVTLAKQLDDPRYQVVIPSQNTTVQTASYVGWEAQGNYYEFNNSRLRAIIAESHMQNTARFTNQTFQLSFQINRCNFFLEDAGAAAGEAYAYNAGVLTNAGYVLNMTYLYNAVYLIGGDGGTTKLITN